METTAPSPPPAPPSPASPACPSERPSGRLVSLDAFRGFTIIGMLWVNNLPDAGRSHQFNHAAWGEFPTFCDMIFPWFLFMVGCAMPFSKASRMARGGSMLGYVGHAARRALVLFALGCLIDSSGAKRPVIGLGVLQLIGLAYFAAVFVVELKPRLRALAALAMLAGYWALIRFLPFPGRESGWFLEDGNAISFINKTWLSPWGVGGFLSVVPAAALVAIGSLAGDWLRRKDVGVGRRALYLAGAGAAVALAGLAWHADTPMSKHLWTSSYILFAGGLGAMVLAGFVWAVDIRGWRRAAFFFTVYGMNAIFAYFVSIMVRFHTVQEWTIAGADGVRISLWNAWINWFAGAFGPAPGAWLFMAAYIGFWWVVLWWLHRRGIFWRV